MNPSRVTVSGLLWVVAVVACIVAALRFASQAWTNIVASLTFLLLMTGLAGAWFAKGGERAFWGGFALFGITYGVLVNWDWVGGQFGHDLTGSLEDLAAIMFPMPVRSPTPSVPRHLDAVLQARDRAIGNFIQIGRCVLSLAVGVIGGLIARRFAGRAAARNEP